MRKKTPTQLHPRRQKPAHLPPIPTDTPEGIRAAIIAETLLAIDDVKALELQDDEVFAIAAALNMPALHVALTYMRGRPSSYDTVEEVERYIAWRHRLAGKAVA